MSLHCENAESSAMNERAMEVQDSNLQLEYEEIKKKLERLEQENKSLKLQSEKNEQSAAVSGKLLLSSLRIYNINNEIRKLVGELLDSSKTLEKLEKAPIRSNDIRLLENDMNEFNEKLIELKNPGFFETILEFIKQGAKKVVPMTKIKSFIASSAVSTFVAVTISHLWSGLNSGLHNSIYLMDIQGAALACLLLKFISEENHNLALKELPGSSKVVLQRLSSLIHHVEPLAITADKLDKALCKGLGMSLYSDEFRLLCLEADKSSPCVPNLDNLNNFILTLNNETRRNVLEVMSDKAMENPLQQLQKVVWNGSFLRTVMLYEACNLIEVLPKSYFSKCEDFVLDAVCFACHQILAVSESERESSFLRDIAAGIIKMRDDYKKITDLYLFTDVKD